MGLTLLRLLVYAHLLGVDEFGRFSAALLVSSGFCMLGCLGLMPMLQREWPVRLVRGQKRRGWLLALQCIGIALALAAGFAAAAVAGGAVVGLAGPVLVLALLHGCTQQVFLVVSTESRSAGDALRYAWQQLARGLALLLGGWALVASGARAEAVLAFEATVTLAVAVAILHRAEGARRLPALLPLALRSLTRLRWRTALTMMGVMLLSFAMSNIDRWLAAEWLGHAAFGPYALAVIVLSTAQAAQALINASGYPLIARRFAAAGPAQAARLSLRISAVTFAAGALVLVPGVVAAQWAVGRWYPDYAPALRLIPWLAAIGLIRAADFWSSFLVIAGHEALTLKLNLASAVVVLAAWALWLLPVPERMQSPVAYVALAAAITLAGGLCTFIAAWRLRRTPQPASAAEAGPGPQRGNNSPL